MNTQHNYLFHCIALSSYQARSDAEISLQVGKIYAVLQKDENGFWWKASDNGKLGWLPVSYVKVCDPDELKGNNHTENIPNYIEQKPAEPTKCYEEKINSPVYLKLQVCKARNLKGIESKSNPIAFIYRGFVLKEKKQKPIFKTSKEKKTNNPHWNEMFNINIHDKELQIITVRIYSSSNNLGEVDIPLRDAVCAFVSPNYQYKWLPLTLRDGTKEYVGDILLYIELVDTRKGHGPTNVKHESHIQRIGDDWQFKNVPSCFNLLKRMNKASHNQSTDQTCSSDSSNDKHQSDVADNQQKHSLNLRIDNEDQHANGNFENTANTDSENTSDSGNNQLYQNVVDDRKNHQSDYYIEQSNIVHTQTHNDSTNEQEVVEIKEVKESVGNFLDQIAGGKFNLKKVENIQKPKPESDGTLFGDIKTRIDKYRKDIVGNDNEDDWE